MNEDRIIAVETSGRSGSVAVARGPDLLSERAFPANVEHARELLPAVDALCREHGWSPQELCQCHVSIGPGSFTGLRVAVTFARHLALATGARICAVPTLDVIAENCLATSSPPQHVAVILDAKRDEVFAAIYARREARYDRILDARMTKPESLLAGAPRPLAVTGEGLARHAPVFEQAGVQVLEESLWRPCAACVHKLGWRMAQQGQFTEAGNLVPLYVRRPEAEELWEKRVAG